MLIPHKIGIIADDLTGANDTALQFHLRGCNTQILLDYHGFTEQQEHTQAWAISTESRNVSPEAAEKRVLEALETLIDNIKTDYFYKKIDSTLRGNIAIEAITMLKTLDWDAAVILPAFPVEGRTTVGGYHLLKGVPLQRTELAQDPHSPICESHIPTLLRQQLPKEKEGLVASIGLDVVMKGAGPILVKLNELVAKGKKLIVVDAVSTTDVEQVAFATEKSQYNILPCGSAGLAQALGNIWFADMTNQNITKTMLQMPKLIISGSATDLTASQIKKLYENDDIENAYFIPITVENVLENNYNDIVQRALAHLVKNNVVVIHSSNIVLNREEFSQAVFDNETSESSFVSKIVEFLARITKEIVLQKELILITVGGETSYKCANAIGSKHLQLIDAITSSIPLTLDHNAQWLVTKSGNLGNQNTLVDLVRYFDNHE